MVEGFSRVPQADAREGEAARIAEAMSLVVKFLIR